MFIKFIFVFMSRVPPSLNKQIISDCDPTPDELLVLNRPAEMQ